MAGVSLCLMGLRASAQIVQFDQNALLYSTNVVNAHGVNYQSVRGVPLSSETGKPIGSDGRLKQVGATPNQFRGLITYGAVVRPRPGSIVAPGLRYAAQAANLGLPVGLDSATRSKVVLAYAQVGAPYLSHAISLLFGGIISPPLVDLHGNQLTAEQSAAYWLPRPYQNPSDKYPNYYWSPNASAVFATQPGPIHVTWKAYTNASPAKPADFNSAPGKYVFEDNIYYLAKDFSLVVSFAPVKPTRKIYWTEAPRLGKAPLGLDVSVPAGKVSGINFIFNTYLVENLTNSTPTFQDSSAAGGKTVWFDPRQGILAYNAEGRVFMEIIGQPQGNAHQYLGFELVDVVDEPSAMDLATDVGDRIGAYADGSDDTALIAKPLSATVSGRFLFTHPVSGPSVNDFYAVKETVNLNDVLVWWTEAGEQGIRWPSILGRYDLKWPKNIAKYSQYVRAPVDSETAAQATATPLPSDNAPVVVYQDLLPDPFGAHLTGDSKFYTYLPTNFPAHRTLLRYNAQSSIAFERVFSWLNTGLTNVNQLAGSVATNLTAWNPTNLSALVSTNPSSGAGLILPRVLSLTARVGSRIFAPSGELTSLTNSVDSLPYLAGYINPAVGTAYSTSAYIDPFAKGFTAADAGSIIPVNATNDLGHLEVWWCRQNNYNPTNGFKPVYWPAVVATYSVTWPLDADQIVLASNQGTTPLQPLEAAGHLYIQNDLTQPGYNPNEEHALLQGGSAWALRDDLNLTNVPGVYSSQPFVLLEFTDVDGRPSIHPFQVVRERPDLGQTFTYKVTAGHPIVPPMPLPLLDVPLVPNQSGGYPPISLNHEVGTLSVTQLQTGVSNFNYYSIYSSSRKTVPGRPPRTVTIYSASVSAGSVATVALQTTTRPPFAVNEILALSDISQSPVVGYQLLVTGIDTVNSNVVGVVTSNAPIQLTVWNHTQSSHSANWRYGVANLNGLASGQSVVLSTSNGTESWVGDVFETGTDSGSGDTYVEIAFRTPSTKTQTRQDDPSFPSTATGFSAADTLVLPFSIAPGSQVWRLSFNALPTNFPTANLNAFYGSFTFQDRKGTVWAYRGPSNSTEQNELAMRFYYRTLPGFWYPGQSNQPPVGTITPYLRAFNGTSYGGDAVYGATNHPKMGDDNALAVHYHPVWPADAPVLDMAQTLTLPIRGLPSVRGNSSLQVLYQQSEATGGFSNRTAVLHDPTVAKKYLFGPLANDSLSTRLTKLPTSIKTQGYLGKTYFPNLPPHLANRLFVDPNVGPNGALVLEGQFVTENVTEPYLLLNVLSPSDVGYIKSICSSNDANYASWVTAVSDPGYGLTNQMNIFVPDTNNIGSFIPSAFSTTIGPSQLAEVTDENMPVDSYALTAVGPGTGFITLVEGNGIAFTQSGDPVSLQVIRVVKNLYPGALNVVASSNPLSEKVALQQVTDLAGQSDQYNFQWLIAAPVNGGPPPVWNQVATGLTSSGPWQQLLFPTSGDTLGVIDTMATGSKRLKPAFSHVNPITSIAFDSVITNADQSLSLVLTNNEDTSIFNSMVPGVRLTLSDALGTNATGTVVQVSGGTNLAINLDAGQSGLPAVYAPTSVVATIVTNQPQTILFQDFRAPLTNYFDLWLALVKDPGATAQVYLDGQSLLANTKASTLPDDLVPMATASGVTGNYQAYPIDPGVLTQGTLNSDGTITHRLVVELFVTPLAGQGQSVNFGASLQGHVRVDLTQIVGSQWLPLATNDYPDGVRGILGGTADVRTLSDNYLIMRYQANHTNHASWVFDSTGTYNLNWSQWTEPMLVEGWIKRVLGGINPFNQRSTDLFNNSVNTDGTILTEAGPRWEGDVALNIDTINNYGLIPIYETVLRRGRVLSVDGGINYGPANSALLLAQGYISDLYTILGNEAWADANNPTISIGSADATYGMVATSLFPFLGQTATLMEQQLDMLRGRDDFAQPGVNHPPVYNRLYWNYTRGINSGEVIYALNYDIHAKPGNTTGSIGADDAKYYYPQGHGDAYGHYLTALTGYYGLLLNPNFSWIPEVEAVTILGLPVQVGYLHERKFAAAAAAVARSGKLIYDLTWRNDYVPGHASGWSYLSRTKVNSNVAGVPRTQYWGADHWATRIGQGAYFNWVFGNSLVPQVDPDPTHEGIQKIDRTTIPELTELPTTAQAIQDASDNAEGGLNPLGLPDNAVAFDLNPALISGGSSQTHFEQVYARAIAALNNAVTAFNDATGVTQSLRKQSDSLANYQYQVTSQEIAYTNQLISIFGTPYTDDIGPGKTYVQDYAGPDTIHFMYVEQDGVPGSLTVNAIQDPQAQKAFNIDLQGLPENWYTGGLRDTFNITTAGTASGYTGNPKLSFTYNLGPRGFAEKPATWTGTRQSPGQLQDAISGIVDAYNDLELALANFGYAKQDFDRDVSLFEAKVIEHNAELAINATAFANQTLLDVITAAKEIKDEVTVAAGDEVKAQLQAIKDGIPTSLIFGLADGGDELSEVRGLIQEGIAEAAAVQGGIKVTSDAIFNTYKLATTKVLDGLKTFEIPALQWELSLKNDTTKLGQELNNFSTFISTINKKAIALDTARRKYQSLLAQADRILQERATFRKHTAGVIQGYRTQDAAFRLFRDEKLERYLSLFDLASRYALLAANAYDYETGLLNTPQGQAFIQKIISSRALGVIQNGQPAFGGSDSGDPGLSSALAEMKADWDTLRGRLGFNNPDQYGTTASLRTENYRILPGIDGDNNWRDLLTRSRMDNILDDSDVRQQCLQINPGGGLPVPGIVISFQTTITDGYNLFGQPLAGGDSTFPSTDFATKIFAVGVALPGYKGMHDPSSTSTQGLSPSDPGTWFLNPNDLAATPEIYLIPVGSDSMRTPPLGDTSAVRSWNVADIAIPVPFNIGGSGYSLKPLWQSSQSLTEPLFATRKHQSFRPVSTNSVFNSLNGNVLQRSQYTNSRLIGRSVWNSQWKLVIPGTKLLNDPNDGLDRFIRTVKDIQLYFQTYSYAGN